MGRIKRKITQFLQWFRKASWKKKIAVIVAVLILLIIVRRVVAGGKKSAYTFDTVQRGAISQLVTENGNVNSSSETDVYSPANGVLDQVYVKNGDTVSTGDKLFTVRSTATAQEQAAAYATYLQAQTALAAEQAKLNSLQSELFQANQAFLNDRGVSNPTDQQKSDPKYVEENADWLAAEANYKNQQGVISQEQAGLNSASLAYQATQNATITAPTNGVVSNIVGLPGAKVVAQLNSSVTASANSTSTVTPVLIIGSSATGTAIQTTVSEVDVDKVSIGQKADIVFSAVPNKTYTGRIVQIDSYGTSTGGVVTYNVFVTIDNPDSKLKPNMTANLTIYTAEKSDVLTVANAAIVPYQNGKAVQTVGKNGKVVFIPVKIGLKGFARSEVLSGVASGTKVILGNTQLTNNQSGGPQGQ